MLSCEYVHMRIMCIYVFSSFPWLHQVPKLPNIINYLYLHILSLLFSKLLILTHPVNFPCGRKPENPRLSAECWRTLPFCGQMFDTGLKPMTSVVGGRRLDDWATNLAAQPQEAQANTPTYIPFLKKEKVGIMASRITHLAIKSPRFFFLKCTCF